MGFLLGFLTRELGALGVLGLSSATPWLVLMGLAGAACEKWWRMEALVWSNAALASLYLLVAITPLAGALSARWVRADPLPADPLGAVVVLASSVTSDTTIDAVATDRLLTGLEMMQRGTAPRIVTTRVVRRHRGRAITSDADHLRLVRLAGQEQAWSVLDTVRSTRDEATRAAEVLQPDGISAIAVVTSPLHTRRACATFEAAGFRVVCVASRERDFIRRRPAGSADRLAAWRAWVYEVLGTVKYAIGG